MEDLNIFESKQALEEATGITLDAKYDNDKLFDFHVSIAKNKINKMLGYDIFSLVGNDAVEFIVPYDDETPYINTPPYTDLDEITIMRCDDDKVEEAGCEWRAITRQLIYSQPINNAVEHCISKCGCRDTNCDCSDCNRLKITAKWVIPDFIAMMVAEELNEACGDNVKRKSIDGFSVEYWHKEDLFAEYQELLSCYSLVEEVDVDII